MHQIRNKLIASKDASVKFSMFAYIGILLYNESYIERDVSHESISMKILL